MTVVGVLVKVGGALYHRTLYSETAAKKLKRVRVSVTHSLTENERAVGAVLLIALRLLVAGFDYVFIDEQLDVVVGRVIGSLSDDLIYNAV